MLALAVPLLAAAEPLEHDAALEAWRRARVEVTDELRPTSPAEKYGPLILYSWAILFTPVPDEEVLVVKDGLGRRYTVPGLARTLGDDRALARYRENVVAARAGGLALLAGGLVMLGVGAWGIDDAINGSGSAAAAGIGAALLVTSPIPIWYGFDYGFGPKRRASRFERYWEADELGAAVEKHNEETCDELGLLPADCVPARAIDLLDEAEDEPDDQESVDPLDAVEPGDGEDEPFDE